MKYKMSIFGSPTWFNGAFKPTIQVISGSNCQWVGTINPNTPLVCISGAAIILPKIEEFRLPKIEEFRRIK